MHVYAYGVHKTVDPQYICAHRNEDRSSYDNIQKNFHLERKKRNSNWDEFQVWE